MSVLWVIYRRDESNLQKYEVYYQEALACDQWRSAMNDATLYHSREAAERVAMMLASRAGDVGKIGVKEIA
jgi:hypothetical protein